MTAPSFSDIPYYKAAYSGSSVASKSGTWLDHRHPEWRANWLKWRYARDVYTAQALDPEKIGSYLIRKGTGETLAAYFERQALADFTSHFGVCADALAGMLFHVEDDANRPAGDLGEWQDPATIAGALWRNADGKNTGYSTLWKQLGIEFVITHCHWVLVDVVNGGPRVVLIEPERVVDWDEDDDGLSWVKVCEQVQDRAGWQSAPEPVEQYCLFTRDGWQRYRAVKGNAGTETAEPVGPPGYYTYEDAAGKRQLPIFRAHLPLKRNVGYPLAKKNVAIFNKESERDFQLRAAAFAKFIVAADDETFKKIAEQVTAGSFIIQDDPTTTKTHRFDAPPTGPVDIATKVLDQKVEHFYKTFFREYSDSAQQKTATEVRQDTASGVGAFLQMLRAGLDDAENQTLWRVEQAVYPNDRSKWFKARVERDDNFQPLNVDEEIERLRIRYFGQTTPVPVDRTALKEVLRQILAWDGIDLDDAALEAALDNHTLLQTKDLIGQLPMPADMKARLAQVWGERLGIVVDAAEAARIAATDQRGKELLAQPFGPPPADTPPVPPAPPTPKTRNVKSDGKGGYVISEGP